MKASYILNYFNSFGIREFLYHEMSNISHSDFWKFKMLNRRDISFSSMNREQLKTVLENEYERLTGEKFDIDYPKTFTQKIQRMKFYENYPLKTILSDKYLVRNFIKSATGDRYLIPLIGAYSSFDEIEFNSLPKRFFLKANHGSGMNYPVKDKMAFMNRDILTVQKKIEYWLKTPFYAQSYELQYRDIPRKILVEEYMGEIDNGIFDYKIHCFHGKPTFIQCIGGRNLSDHTGFQKNYDLNWNELDWTFADYPDFPYDIPKPKCLNEMKNIAEILSKDFAYVRVDLYEVNGNVFFGEMTFTPASGIYPYRGSWTREKDQELGNLL